MVGDTPEAVEFRGMQNLLAAAQEHLGFRDGKLIFSADGQVCFLTTSPCSYVLMAVTLGCMSQASTCIVWSSFIRTWQQSTALVIIVHAAR